MDPLTAIIVTLMTSAARAGSNLAVEAAREALVKLTQNALEAKREYETRVRETIDKLSRWTKVN